MVDNIQCQNDKKSEGSLNSISGDEILETTENTVEIIER